MTRGRLAVHAHFYQPSRLDPWTGRVPVEPSAAPYHDWNERVHAECYRPNAERGTLRHLSWNLGPTLAAWMANEDASAHQRFVADSASAIAQPYHHAILPLASGADRRTEIAWGIRDFEIRFGRRPVGLWLPETAVDRATLREAARQGIAYTILAPWQAAGSGVDTRRPYRIDLGGGEGILAVFFDSGLSASVSFEPEATSDADRFARERVAPRLQGGPAPIDAPLALIATDGELKIARSSRRRRSRWVSAAPSTSRTARAAALSTWRVSGRTGSSQNQPSLANIARRQRCASSRSRTRALSSAAAVGQRSAANSGAETTPRTTSIQASLAAAASTPPGSTAIAAAVTASIAPASRSSAARSGAFHRPSSASGHSPPQRATP